MTQIRCFARGFAMFELVLAIALSGMVATWAASVWMRHVDDALAQATGAWMLTVHGAMNQMLRRQSDFMSGMTVDLSGAAQYADLYQPTIAELVSAGHLPKGFAHTPPIPYLVSIVVSAPEGDCEKMGCRIEALTYASPPPTQRSQASDITRIGKILTALQGAGGSVHPLRADRITGPNLDIPNFHEKQRLPLPAGSVVTKSFYDSSKFGHLVRREDRRDTRLDGQLNVKKGIVAESDIHTSGGMQSSGRISAGEFLHLQGLAIAHQPCQADGLVARNAESELLTCHDGRWRSPGTRFGGVYSWHSMHGCGEVGFRASLLNPLTGGCFCPPDFNPVQISRWKGEASDIDEFRTYICLR